MFKLSYARHKKQHMKCNLVLCYKFLFYVCLVVLLPVCFAFLVSIVHAIGLYHNRPTRSFTVRSML